MLFLSDPPHILLSIIVNDGAGGSLSLHTISSIYFLRCLEAANLMNVSAYLIGLLICISLVIMKRKNETFYITASSFCLCNSACSLQSLDHVGLGKWGLAIL